MTGIISTYIFIVLASQLGAPSLGNSGSAIGPNTLPPNTLGGTSAPSSVRGLSDGWKIDRDGTLSYIVQMSPETASEIATRGEEVRVDIPANLQGVAENVVLRIGNGPVERELSEEQLRARQRARMPSDSRNAGISNLNSLSDRASGGIVPIDPLKSTPPIRSTGNGGLATRSTENDLAMQVPFSSPPSLGSSRSGFTSSETLPPMTPPSIAPTLPPSFSQSNGTLSTNGNLANGSVGSNGLQSNGFQSNGLNNNSSSGYSDNLNSTRNGLNNSSNPNLQNGSFVGPPSPPYTGGNVTVVGTPTNDRLASNQYPNSQPGTNPFSTGTFGGGNSFAPTNNWNHQGGYSQQANGQSTIPYNNQLNGPLNGPLVSTFNGQFNNQQPAQYLPGMTPMPSMASPYGNNPWRNDSSNNAQTFNNALGNNGANAGYPPTSYNSSTPTLPYSPRLAQTNNSLRNIPSSSDLNADMYGNPTSKPGREAANGLAQLLLVISLVVNVYLILQISNLFNSYRALQLSKRAETSYASET